MKKFLCVVAAAAGVSVGAADFVLPEQLPEVRELPDLFTKLDGTKVTRGQEWFERRVELLDLLQRGMYGRMPGTPGGMKAVVREIAGEELAEVAVLEEVTLSFSGPVSPPLHLLVVRPRATKPVSAFLCINFNGNQAVLTNRQIRMTTNWISGVGNSLGVSANRMTESGRGAEEKDWQVRKILERGHAFVTFHCADIEPDREDAKEGTRAAYPNSDWGAVAAWAWGFHRAMDFLVTHTNIAAGRIAAVGWSRNGKAALLAAATDQRISMVFPHQAGCGGTAPSRHWIGGGAGAVETIERINSSFPHWFNADFKNFAKTPERLPFDQHALVAACAPRPVCLTAAMGDAWSNPRGQFEVLKAASAVYELLEVGRLEAKELPVPNFPNIEGVLGFGYRAGAHSLTGWDWDVFLNFAAKHWK